MVMAMAMAMIRAGSAIHRKCFWKFELYMC